MRLLFVLLVLVIVSGCENAEPNPYPNCDCSIENYERLKVGQLQKNVEKILRTKASTVVESPVDYKKRVTYKCEEKGDEIYVEYSGSYYQKTYRVSYLGFNLDDE